MLCGHGVRLARKTPKAVRFTVFAEPLADLLFLQSVFADLLFLQGVGELTLGALHRIFTALRVLAFPRGDLGDR